MTKRSWSPLYAASLLTCVLIVYMLSGPLSLVAQPSDSPSSPAHTTACRSLSLQYATPTDPMFERVVGILVSRIQERTRIKPTRNGKASCKVELTVRQGIGKEGFRIEDASRGAVRIVGNDNRGLLYGVGKFLRGNTYRDGSFTWGGWRGTSVPEKPLRGVYPATHYFNFYHEAPVEQLQRYMEDLALWGFNWVVFDYDMHHFTGIQDPAAQAMLNRMHLVGKTAKNVGLDIGLGMAVNDAYSTSPPELRADWTAGHDGYTRQLRGHYHLELCPNKPGAKELLLKWQEESFQTFKDLGVEYVIPWPYDNGGCTCSLCKPWGVNGYLALAEPIAEMARRNFPGCKIILSTWLFDIFTSGEFAGLEEKFAKERPKWVDYILGDDIEYGDYAKQEMKRINGVERYSGNPPAHRVPGGFPLIGFPEVSMWGARPWGGFGANPLPAHYQDRWNLGKDSLAGGFLYSEGIYEDLNKVLYAQFYWQKDRPAGSIVDEYIAYEFSPKVVAPVRRAIDILETNLPRRGFESIARVGAVSTIRAENVEEGAPRFVLEHSSGAEEAWNLFREADKQLSPRARASWRWRILYLRALIDDELVKNDFRVSPRCDEAFQELTKIYYAQNADFLMAPPSKEAIAKLPTKE